MDIFFPLHTFRNAGYFIITIFDFDNPRSHPTIAQHVWNVAQWLGREGQKSGKKWVQVAFTNRELHLLLEWRWSLHFLHTFREIVLLRDAVLGKTGKILKNRNRQWQPPRAAAHATSGQWCWNRGARGATDLADQLTLFLWVRADYPHLLPLPPPPKVFHLPASLVVYWSCLT